MWNEQTKAWRNIVMFGTGYSTLSMAFPVLVVAPRYILGKITLGAGQSILRRWKHRHPASWMETAGTPASIGGDDSIGPGRRTCEYMLNLLRLHEGFALADFEAWTGLPAARIGKQLEQAQAQGWLAASDGRIVPTGLGRRFTNDVVGLFLVL